MPTEYSVDTAMHELGHAFSLHHDFSDRRYLMSYERDRDRLSVCSAQLLSVHPHFNRDIPVHQLSEDKGPLRTLTSSYEYILDTTPVPIRIRATDPDGIHQVVLFVETGSLHQAAGFLEVKSFELYRGRENITVSFDYDGKVPSHLAQGHSYPTPTPLRGRQRFFLYFYDRLGNRGVMHFELLSIPSRREVKFIHSNSHISVGDRVAPLIVTSVAFSPDGRYVASGSGKGEVKLWDLDRKRNIWTKKHGNSVGALAFSPDGKVLASGGSEGTVKFWNMASGTDARILQTATVEKSIRALVFAPDATFLYAGLTRNKIVFWNLTKGAVTYGLSYIGMGNVNSLALSPDGTTLISGSGDGKIRAWRHRSGDEDLQELWAINAHTESVHSVAFAPDGNSIASAGLETDPSVTVRENTRTSDRTDSVVKFWDFNTRRQLGTIETDTRPGFSYQVRSIDYSPSGKQLAVGSWDNTVKLYGTQTPFREIVNLGYHNKPGGCVGFVYSVDFAASGTLLASGTLTGSCGGYVGSTKPFFGEVHLWNMEGLGTGTRWTNFNMYLDGNLAPGNHAVSALDVAPGTTVTLQVLLYYVPRAKGVKFSIEYDAKQLEFQGFKPSNLLPNAQVLITHHENPNAVEINLVSFDGEITDGQGGTLGELSFTSREEFTGTTIRLTQAEVGQADQTESKNFTNRTMVLNLKETTPSADFNKDGVVNFADFLAFGEHFGRKKGQPGWDAKYDLDSNGEIGFGDFLIFGASFGA